MLKPIIIKYTNVIGYYVLKDGKFVQSSKEELEEFAARTETGCKKDFAEWIMYAQDHLANKHEEAKSLKTENAALTKQAKELNRNTKDAELQASIKEKDKQIQQQQKALEEKEATIREKESEIETLKNSAVIDRAAARTNTEDTDEHTTQATEEQNKLLSALASQQKRLVENIKTKDDAESINRVHRTRIEMIQPFHNLHTESFENWFFVVDKFQKTNKIKDEDMLDVLTPLFRGNALLMLKRFEGNNGRGKYREFMEKLKNLTDVKVNKDTIRRKLDQLVQRESFESYKQKFMGWVQQIDDMSDAELLYRFESGLKPDARNQLVFMKE